MAQNTDFTNFATEHPNYFSGQYLLADDFRLQHKYLAERQKYSHKSLHVSGIIEGLKIEVIDNKEVHIESGSAIDSNGNLIVLKEKQVFSNFKNLFKNLAEGELYIKYASNKDIKQQENIQESYTRWVEIPHIEFADVTPEGCVKLAKLTITKGKITPDPNIREYSGLSLPSSNSKSIILRSGGNQNQDLAVLSGSLKIDRNLTVTEDLSVHESVFLYKGFLTIKQEISENEQKVFDNLFKTLKELKNEELKEIMSNDSEKKEIKINLYKLLLLLSMAATSTL